EIIDAHIIFEDFSAVARIRQNSSAIAAPRNIHMEAGQNLELRVPKPERALSTKAQQAAGIIGQYRGHANALHGDAPEQPFSPSAPLLVFPFQTLWRSPRRRAPPRS